MDVAMKEFGTELKDGDVELFFFAGHGMQIEGENYLAAVDADADSEVDAKHSSLPLNRMIETMEKPVEARALQTSFLMRSCPGRAALTMTDARF
jgi:uncharacterized caspase-like protein